jgi:ribosomal protein S17
MQRSLAPFVGATIKRIGNMRLVGRVVSAKMQKTVIVRVDHKVWHTKYRRFFVRRKRMFAHDHGIVCLSVCLSTQCFV